ncbi:2-C-methyl-D-erythritol 4-phosphate cytidylyltransferase [Candidatus Berkiella cookevillensis]|uniref:2-C-methyl-D-erythritol 4-phosphate cytidylyltransferase n=1 Tax=Candidatus Berkiella cookevillensis TaxID=437022 RepID=A0A0Q9YTR1_9GAMM|nr:2-C-methyl-D-erythritol 4-phosphate cytidylyltransferase [Candidatus Berkiella cookevillensis]MCS5708384.1 2-C-methyl-D-erythritol 4-phosphate cytidylyltransferase [Candidatus Berkiella cookevillensis]
MTNKFFIIIPAAGIGQRFLQNSALPKQYERLQSKTVLEHVIDLFLAQSWITEVVVALHPEDKYFSKIYAQRDAEEIPKLRTVIGGKSRAESVWNALHSMQTTVKAHDWILVHDAARPCLSQRDLLNLIAQLKTNDIGGILAEKLAGTIKHCEEQNTIGHTVNRDRLWQALTPQMFKNDVLYKSLAYCFERKYIITDEAQAVERFGLPVKLIEAQDINLKITYPKDLALANAILASQEVCLS